MPENNGMNKPGRSGFTRIYWAAHYSWRGLTAAWKNEAAFRQEFSLMLILLPLACWLGTTLEQRLLLIAPCFLVIVTELLNSAIEAAIDRIGPEHHTLSGQAKDMGSAAVFFSLMLVLLSWGSVAWHRFS